MDRGTVINGFRVERLLGEGSLGAVYEATQLSLGRTVALRLVAQSTFSDPELSDRSREQQRLSASVHHPNIVPTYEAGDWAQGRFVATRYVRGRTLADLREAGSLSPPRVEALLEPIADALDVAHAAGLVHGRVTAQNVLVDAGGTAYLADLGLGRSGSVAADRQALAAVTAQAQRGAGRRRARSFAALALAGFAGLAVVVTAVLLVAWGEGDGEAHVEPPPPVSAETVPLGSDLASGSARSVGCSDTPGPNTPTCTLSQSTIAGRPVTVRSSGVIRGWAVRGAAGELALQVIGSRDGETFLRGFSQVERVVDRAPHAFEANVPVERGDRVGVVLTPGSSIGARSVSGRTSASQWQGTLSLTPESQRPTRLDSEVLLRTDIDIGARPDLPRELTGSRAATAATGRPLAEQIIDLSSRLRVRVALVRLPDGIAIDASRGGRRLARIDVPDAGATGRLLDLDGQCGYRRGFCLRWLNADATPVIHAYRLARDGTAFQLIG